MRLSFKSAITVLALTAASLFVATPAQAADFSVDYELTSNDLSISKWPVGTSQCNSEQSWLSFGSKFYVEKNFRVSQTGFYRFMETRSSTGNQDGVMLILTGSLNPNDVSNCVYSIDDVAPVGLQAGVTYTMALSSYDLETTGTFAYQVSGPGSILVGNLAESELVVGPSTADTESDVVLTAEPVSNLLGVDLSGTVTFTVNGSGYPAVPVEVTTGQASLSLGSQLAPGSYTVNAEYSGVSGKTFPSSNTITLTVTPTQTVTTLDISPAEIVEGTQTTYTANVSGINPTGNVEFYSGNVLAGTAPVANGVASITLSPSAGTHNITANYLGDTNYTASSSQEKSILVKPSTKPDPQTDPKPKTPANTALANTGAEPTNLTAPITAGIALAAGLTLLLARRKAAK